jgi:hypothetical protein
MRRLPRTKLSGKITSRTSQLTSLLPMMGELSTPPRGRMTMPTDEPPEDTEDNAEWKESKSDEPAKMTPIHEEEGADVTTDDEETNEC